MMFSLCPISWYMRSAFARGRVFLVNVMETSRSGGDDAMDALHFRCFHSFRLRCNRPFRNGTGNEFVQNLNSPAKQPFIMMYLHGLSEGLEWYNGGRL